VRINVRSLEIGRLRNLALPLRPGPCCVPWASAPWHPAQSFAYICLSSTLGGGFCAGSSDWLDTNAATRIVDVARAPGLRRRHSSRCMFVGDGGSKASVETSLDAADTSVRATITEGTYLVSLVIA
jgi:hypothetical protein